MSSPACYDSVNISNNSLYRIRTTGESDSRSFVLLLCTMCLGTGRAQKRPQTRMASVRVKCDAAEREPKSTVCRYH